MENFFSTKEEFACISLLRLLSVVVGENPAFILSIGISPNSFSFNFGIVFLLVFQVELVTCEGK